MYARRRWRENGRKKANGEEEGANAWEVHEEAPRWIAEAPAGEGKNNDFAWEVFEKVESAGVA